MGYGSLYEKTAGNLNEPYTIIVEFAEEVYSDNSRADVKVKQIVRRYVEQDRDVIIRVSHAAPIAIKNKLLRGLAYNLEEYVVTMPSPASTPSHQLSNVNSVRNSLDQDIGKKFFIETFRALTDFIEIHGAKNLNSLANQHTTQYCMAFLQEDDAAFEAALSFLDEFAPGVTVADDNLSALDQEALLTQCDAQDTSDCRPQETTRTHRQPRGKRQLTEEEKKRRKTEFNEKRRLLRKAGVYGDANRARNERSKEIAYLREQTEKLQIDLQILQSRLADTQNEEIIVYQENTGTLSEGNVESQITSMWQGLADQQRRRRQEAERDNVLLRLAVERQRKLADSLQSHMQRRTTQLTNECASLVTTARSNAHSFNVLDFCGDLESFRGLFRRLDLAYQKMDDVFMDNGLAGMTISPVDVHVHERSDGNSLEFASYKVLPFDVRATSEAAWKHFKGVDKHLANGSLYEKAEKGLDEPYTIIADFKKETFSNSSVADIQVKQVIRRYVEEDRDVVIWVSRAVSIAVKHKLLRGLTYHLQGYAVTKRSSESTPDREVSVLQLSYLVSLDQDSEMKCDATNLHALINFLATTVAQNIRAHRENIENMLIDRSLRLSAC